MRGCLKKRYKGSWSIILDFGYEPDVKDPTKLRRKQKWVTFHGTRKQAETKLTELLGTMDNGTFVDTSTMTFGAWLREWLDAVVKPTCRPATYTRYHGIIENHLCRAAIAALPVQKLRASHLEQYYATAGVSANTLPVHHTVIRRALRKAVKDRLVTVNVAVDLEATPRRARGRSDEAQRHCWTPEEAPGLPGDGKGRRRPASGPVRARARRRREEGRALRPPVV
jgi:hypothetical protein